MNQTIRYDAADPAVDLEWSFFVHNDSDRTAYQTSQKCAAKLNAFMQRPALVAVASEASSQVAGLEALYAQPWLWAGGGLGNIDECPLQTCFAGVSDHSSLIFASLCVVPECHAVDVAADDFAAMVTLAAEAAGTDNDDVDDDTVRLAQAYAGTVQRMHQVNKFLNTGWTCGELNIPFRPWPWGVPYIVTLAILLATGLYATLWQRRPTTTHGDGVPRQPPNSRDKAHERNPLLLSTYEQEEEEENVTTSLTCTPPAKSKVAETITPATSASTLSFCWRSLTPSSSSSSIPDDTVAATALSQEKDTYQNHSSISAAFDLTIHWRQLFHTPSPSDTSILDGLRVGSMCWIILGHVMAICSSTGAGYANPTAFLPPFGVTNTLLGQLLFSSRLAVDTFLVLSGFLTVHVVSRKLPLPPMSSTLQHDNVDNSRNPLRRYVRHFPSLLLARVIRIFPLYAMCILFYTQVAPLLGSGPFWYQWLALLQPCHDSLWSNLLFVNNFWPPNQPITSTCFYHSWYLAVDLQLFLVAVGLVFWYQSRPSVARVATLVLCLVSALGTAVAAAVRQWSVNSFDGAAVVRYDTEAYAKPWIRAVAYLTGMYVAMLLPRSKLTTRSPWRSSHHWTMVAVLVVMAVTTFGTALGAYGRRACRPRDWPEKDECGSEWSPFVTWLYTSTSRVMWCACLGIILHLCLGRPSQGNPVSAVLSWSAWTPLSHLTFGAYLIHPVVIFIWQLGSRQKEDFRLVTFGMNYVSVVVVSYGAALVMALTVECPLAALWKIATKARAESSSLKSKSASQQHLPVMYGSVS